MLGLVFRRESELGGELTVLSASLAATDIVDGSSVSDSHTSSSKMDCSSAVRDIALSTDSSGGSSSSLK